MSGERFDYRGTDPKAAYKALREVDAAIHDRRRKMAVEVEDGAVSADSSELSKPVAGMFRHMAKMDRFRAAMAENERINRPIVEAKAAGTYQRPTPIPIREKSTDSGLAASGAIVELPDFDDTTELWEADKETASHSDAEAEGLRLRDGEFAFYCRNRAGEIVDAELKEKSEIARRKIDGQSMDLALALSGQGIRAFLPAKAPRASIVDPLSRQRVDITPFRRINFLPAVAKMRRAGMLKHLIAYAEKRPFLRMATFTIGQLRRLDIRGEVNAGFRFLGRRVSKLNSHPLFKSHGAHLVFRSSEGGSLKRACPFPRQAGTEAGVIYVHIHAHTFLYFDKQLSPRRFKRFMAKVWNLWRFHWDFGRTIVDPNEACKYPFKGDDMEHLTDAEKAALFHETRKLHLVQPLGELREIIAARHQFAIKGRNWRCAKTSELELKFRPDWNARPRMTPEQRRAREAQRRRMEKLGLATLSDAARLINSANTMLAFAAKYRRTFTADAFAAILRTSQALTAAGVALIRFGPRPAAEQRLAGIRKIKEADKAAAKPRPMQNRVCARLGPAPYFDRITRPALLVWNFDGNYDALRALPLVQDYERVCGERIAAAEAALNGAPISHRVHTSHLTVTRAGGPEPSVSMIAAAEFWPEAEKTPHADTH